MKMKNLLLILLLLYASQSFSDDNFTDYKFKYGHKYMCTITHRMYPTEDDFTKLDEKYHKVSDMTISKNRKVIYRKRLNKNTLEYEYKETKNGIDKYKFNIKNGGHTSLIVGNGYKKKSGDVFITFYLTYVDKNSRVYFSDRGYCGNYTQK